MCTRGSVCVRSPLPSFVTMTVGYDQRFSGGDYGIWVECPPEKARDAEALLRDKGAVEVRSER